MSISRVHTWVSGEVLTASDLNAEFNNLINNALAFLSPLTGSLDFNSNAALNFRFQNQSATQSAGAEGVAYWHSGEDTLHISTGTLQARVPALTNLRAGELIGTSPTAVDGATAYSRIQLSATQFSLVGSELNAKIRTVLAFTNDQTTVSTAGTYYAGGACPFQSGDINAGKFPLPYAGIAKNLYCAISSALTAGNSMVFTLLVDGVATALTATISAGGTTASDTTHQVSIPAGSVVQMQMVKTGTDARDVGVSAEYDG